ncbi:MAG: Mov34/MPN/PAD-1 family protein [Akkermansiaceae bacterium]|nr:Mov34/MPN/PAD-1 family protein [Akkermansiaceae bacterium]
MLITCSATFVRTTLDHLQDAGRRRCECVVLWLGRRDANGIVIQEAYRPLQTAEVDMFHIPPEGMASLHAVMRQRRLMVAAQVHSHPSRAFHSDADDRWAIVRHEGALSLVLPYFAAGSTISNFMSEVKVYCFSSRAEWLEVPTLEVDQCLRIC